MKLTFKMLIWKLFTDLILKRAKIIRSLAEFEQIQRQNAIKPQQTLVFDLHLEIGRKALEIIEDLPGGSDYPDRWISRVKIQVL